MEITLLLEIDYESEVDEDSVLEALVSYDMQTAIEEAILDYWSDEVSVMIKRLVLA